MTEQNVSSQAAGTYNSTAGLNKYVELSKDQLDAIAALGFRFFQQGKQRDAEILFEGLIALDPNLYYGHAGLGALALHDEKLDAAVGHLKRAAALEPKDATVYANLGEALLRQAKFHEAAGQFERALNLDPEQRNTGANRARAILHGMNLVVSEIQRVGGA